MYFCAQIQTRQKITVNYEELIESRKAAKPLAERMHVGNYYREQVDGKWRGVVDIFPSLNQSIAFVSGLRKECEENLTLASSHQVHFTPITNEQGDIVRLELEPGVYQSFQQMLSENPAIVASDQFVENTLQSLVDVTTYLHSRGIRHLCYSPSTVLARKGDHAALLLNHGSYYAGMEDLTSFYGDDADYVAPEVLAHGAVDDRCDVYSIGKFMQSLFGKGDMPLAYRRVMKKATSEKPEDRYDTPAELLKAVKKSSDTFKSLIVFAAAVLIALVIWVAYFDAFPETNQVEFVKPAPRQATDDLIEDGFDPSELGVVSADSLSPEGQEELEAQRNYEAKAEAIFRKKFEQEADRILSKIYNKQYMSNSEKQFMTESESTTQELMMLQHDIGAEANLDPSRSQLIASEIIERLTEQKKKELGGTNSRSIQK